MAVNARTIDELVRLNAHHNKDHVAVIESPSGDQNAQSYTSKQIDDFACQVASVYADKYDLKPRNSSHHKPKVVAICGSGDFGYLVTFLAIAKLGHTTLFLSPRLPYKSCAALLRAANATLLLVQEAQQALANSLRDDSLDVAAGFVLPIDKGTLADNRSGKLDTNLTADLDLEAEKTTTVFILHSSGSTSLPKLVSLANGIALHRFGFNRDRLGLDTLTTVPLHHAFGMSSLFRCFICQTTVYLYSRLPITTSHLLQVTQSRTSACFYAVPFTLSLLAESEDGMRFLRSFKVIATAGAPLPEDLGTKLVRLGVQLVSLYGSSETGTLLTSLRPAEDKGWNWLRAPREIGHLLRFEQQGSDTYELICPKEWPLRSDSNQDDGSWRTKDLFIRHPTMWGAFKYVGRVDDILVLENGEKFNPISVENEISSSPFIDGCIIFGTGKPTTGIAVIPSKSTANMTTEELRLLLRSVIERSQSSLPAYGQISEGMILLLPRDSLVPRTDKGTIIRGKFLKAFEKEIQSIYDNQDATVGTRVYSKNELLDFLSEQLVKVLHLPPETEPSHSQDFSTFGLDSLQAIQFRTTILRHVNLGGNALGINVVFDYPTVASLAEEICRVSSGAEAPSTEAIDERDAADMLERYANFESKKKQLHSLGETIVLTGATGSLGSHLLTNFTLSSSVKRVYCLVSEHKLFTPSPWNSTSFIIVDGVRHLIDLCLENRNPTPARFIFFSSISTILGTSEAIIPERLPKSLAEASHTGYARSKYVAEHICAKAAAEVGLLVAILRIGQIVGDTVSGIWNTSEAVPLMIRSAQTIGALPTLQGRVRWLPVDDVARIAIEIGSSDAVVPSQASIFNIVNPHTLRWTEDLLPLLANNGLSFQAVSPSLWLRQLEESDTNPQTNPPRKLLQHFKRQCKPRGTDEDREWETNRTTKWSSTFRNSTAPSPQLISAILQYFKVAWKT
ncbi:hypothetical protein FGADI_7355 [Fusarium gaditjirri]|uniref:Carrier domain-containing protein n=1 Tax=Fusarium gaditjirri TaxID=282569 RepID=A0A8H4T592_9HYPO|nr:hypothetical protein FGADI_7355 [Fusarium gaditjirri]